MTVIDLEAVRAERAQVRPGLALAALAQGLLTAAVFVPWALGWATGKTVVAASTAVAAFKVGWRAGRATRRTR